MQKKLTGDNASWQYKPRARVSSKDLAADPPLRMDRDFRLINAVILQLLRLALLVAQRALPAQKILLRGADAAPGIVHKSLDKYNIQLDCDGE